MRGFEYVEGVGVVDRGRAGGGVDIEDVGTVDRLPEVV
jgi:hypothetical protein